MEIKISWSSFSNINFKGNSVIDVDEEDWETMDEDERSEFIRDQVIEESGFSYEHEAIKDEQN